MTNDDNHLTGKCCSGYPNCYHALKNSVTPKMTNDDKNFQELKELLINKASDMGFTYSTYGLESLAEAILDAGYSRPTPQQPNGYDMDGNPIQYGLSGGSQQPNNDKDLKCPDYVESAFRKWFEYSPCFICGYKGGGYYQIKDHPCAEHYHNRTLSKLWDMDGNPIQHSLSGVPQQPSEPMKELDEKAILMVLDQCCPVSMDKMAKEMIAQILWNKFGQPSEKKALSRDGITDIIRIDLRDKMKKGKLGLVGYTRTELAEELSQAIHSALPAQREVRYPDTAYVDKNDGKPGRIEKINYCLGWNHCIDEFKKLNGG